MRKISFLQQKKTAQDKLFDLVNHTTKIKVELKKIKKKNKKGKYYTRTKKVYVRKGINILSKTLKVKTADLNKWLKFGIPKNKAKKIDATWKKMGLSATKKQTLEFHRDSLTKENFFKPKKLRGLKSNKEQYFFRCGIYLECVSNTNKNATYIINNLPIPVSSPPIRSDSYTEGFWMVFDEIKKTLQSYPSIKLWRINYFDVTIIDLSTQRRSEENGANYHTYVQKNDSTISKKRLKQLKNKYYGK